ncbi:MAG: hypothetical protein KF849_01115 [Rhizobiaceae bacterium]|nr:hypothetical protein [Rhizobiaceae bacterium]
MQSSDHAEGRHLAGGHQLGTDARPLFLLLLAPAAAFVAFMPDEPPASVVVTVVFAWALRAAMRRRFNVAALMQVCFKVIEGQQPDAVGSSPTDASRHFVRLRKAVRLRRVCAAPPQGGQPAGSPRLADQPQALPPPWPSHRAGSLYQSHVPFLFDDLPQNI